MDSPALTIEAARPEQFDAIVALVAEAGLPTRDLSPPSMDGFLVATDMQGNVVGAAALERYGATGLLRSLVVAPGYRNNGLGAELVSAIEQRARSLGLESLVLLTETASDFFAALGYTRERRDAAPESVKASSEFAYVCPASAAFMGKRLGRSGLLT